MYKDIEEEKKRLEDFKKTEGFPVVLTVYMPEHTKSILVGCRVTSGGISPLLVAAFPHADMEELRSLTRDGMFHSAISFMEKLGDDMLCESISANSKKFANWRNFGIGKLCYAYTDDKNWNSDSLFFIIPLDDSKKIAELLKYPRIEKATSEKDMEETKAVYSRLFWKTSFSATKFNKLVKPGDIVSDILRESIEINARLDISDVQEVARELVRMGFRSMRFKNVFARTEEEADVKKDFIGRIRFLEFSTGPVEVNIFIDPVSIGK